MNDIKQFKSILKQGILRNTDVLLGCEFLEKLLNIINDYENTKNQLQQKENIIKEVREYLDIDESIRKNCKRYDVNGIAILEILDKEVN
jgi:hypothetical protein